MKCPSCGLENNESATYCDDCGALLASSGTLPEQPARCEPLAQGTVVADVYRIESSEPRGVFNVYEATRLADNEPRRILEDAEHVEAAPAAAPAEGEGSEAPPPEAYPSSASATRAVLIHEALKEAASPHLWEVSDIVTWEGRTMVVGTPLPSWSLQAYLEQDSGPLDADELKALGLSLLDAVDTLHRRGYLHLGIHPANIYLDEEGMAILDGYERLARQDALPEACSVLEGYSAPEAYGIGGSLCAASDVFGVGATLYYAIARQLPTQANREQFFTFAPLAVVVPGTPADLERIVMKAVRKDLAARYQSAAQMIDDLDKAVLEPGPVPAPPPVPAAVSAPVGPASPPASPAGASVASSSPAPVTEEASVGGATTEQLTAVRVTAPPPATGFMPYRVGLKSHVGCVREVNQDSMLVMSLAACERSIPTNALLVIVADGMGGEAEGDKASSLAIRGMVTHVLEHHLPIHTGPATGRLESSDPVTRLEELLRESMEVANQIIFEYSQEDSSRRGMGSTLTSLMIDWPYAVFGHAGDTRAYLLRSKLDQVTEDHSLVGKLVRLGQLTREEARTSPQRSYLYRAMGTTNELEVDVYNRRLEPGDRMLVCSDGVWEYFTDEEIVDFLTREDDPQAACDALIAEVLRRGADDNCTAVVLFAPNLPTPDKT